MLLLFRPAILLMNRLRYAPKLALIALLFLLPLAGAGYFILHTNLQRQLIIEQELKGTAFTRPTFGLLSLIQEYRWQTGLMLTQEDSEASVDQETISALRQAIDQQLIQLDQLRAAQPQIITHTLWQQIQTDWKNLQAENSALKIYSQQTAFIQQLIQLINDISRNSSLTLDSEVDSYFLMSAVQFRLPLLTESLWQAKASGSYWLSDGEVDAAELEDIAVKRDRINEVLNNIKTDFQESIQFNTSLTTNVNKAQLPILETTETLFKFWDDTFVERSDFSTEAIQSHQELILNAVEKSHQAYYQISDLLDQVLRDRLTNAQDLLAYQLLCVLIAVLIALYFFIGAYISWFNLLQKALETSNKITAGDFTATFRSDSRDEYGVLLEKILGSLQNSHFSIIAELPIGVFVTDAMGRCTYTNHTWQKIYGLSLEDSLGEGWGQTLHPEDKNAVFSTWQDSAEQKKSFSMEFRVLRADGSLRHVHARARPLQGNQYIESGFVGSVEDITERKIILEQLQLLVSHANAASKAKSEFLANMSHEIRTPMNAIIGLTRLCLGTELNTKQRDYVEKVFYSSQSLLGIINDILDFSKIEAGKLEMESIPFNLQEALSRVYSIMEPKASEKYLQLIVECPPITGRLLGDPFRLNQILLNLVGNAIKFTTKGHVSIKVSVLQMTEDHLHLYFSIQDTGIGMTEEQTAKLFQSFVQADNSITRQFGGTGLGLAICKNLVELMQGKIALRSQPGVGTDFYFDAVFGRAPEEVDQHNQSSYKISELQSLGGIKVLVAEDNLINQQVAEEMLTQAGLKVVIANNGLEAVNLFKQEDFDLVLMDMQMPVMDGVTAAMSITQWEHYSATPIIAMTANAMQSDRDDCFNAGMVDHVPKPVDPDILFSTIIRWVKPSAQDYQNIFIDDSAADTAYDESAAFEDCESFGEFESTPVETKTPTRIVSVGEDELPDVIPYVDIDAVLKRLGGNRAFVHKLLASFAKQNADTGTQLRNAIAEENWELAERISHTMKGTAGTIGIMSVSTTAAALNDVLKEKRYSESEPLVKAFIESLDQVISGLKILS